LCISVSHPGPRTSHLNLADSIENGNRKIQERKKHSAEG
jgi:hypothetical protein